MPFDQLKSTEAQSRLSVCRPQSGLEEASCATGVPRYTHNTGGVIFRRWASSQVANTMGLVLNKTNGKSSGLTAGEVDAVHDTNNKLKTRSWESEGFCTPPPLAALRLGHRPLNYV